MSHARQVILKPVVSEKSYEAMEQGVYTFVVAPDANKIQIRKAVEEIFEVKVANVNTMNRNGKRKRDRSRMKFGKRPDTKRAVITLAGDDRIEIFES